MMCSCTCTDEKCTSLRNVLTSIDILDSRTCPKKFICFRRWRMKTEMNYQKSSSPEEQEETGEIFMRVIHVQNLCRFVEYILRTRDVAITSNEKKMTAWKNERSRRILLRIWSVSAELRCVWELGPIHRLNKRTISIRGASPKIRLKTKTLVVSNRRKFWKRTKICELKPAVRRPR